LQNGGKVNKVKRKKTKVADGDDDVEYEGGGKTK